MLQYFVGSNPGELYSFTKDFVLINLCPGHKSYWRINPAEAEAIKTDLKRGCAGIELFPSPKRPDRL